MAKSDVDLVIRARNQASKAVDAVTAALKDLQSAQKDAGKSAKQTDGIFAELGRELGDLAKQAQALGAFGKVAAQLDRATGAVERLEAEVRSATGEFTRFARESDKVNASVGRLKAQIDSEEKAIKDSAAARKAASTDLKAADKAVAQAERNQARYNKTLAATPKPSSALRSAGTFLADDADSSRAAQALLKRDVQSYTDQIERSRKALQGLKPQVAAASAEQKKLAAETDKASNALRTQRANLITARQETAAISATTDRARESLGDLATTQERVAQSSARVAAEMAKTKARIDALASVPKGRSTPGGNAEAASFVQQRRAVEQAKRAFSEAEVEVKKLAEAIRDTNAPTVAQGEALGRAQGKARLAKAEYQRLQVELLRLKGTAKSTFAEFDQAALALKATGLTSAQRQLQQQTVQAGNAIRAIRPAAEEAAKGMREAADDTISVREALGGLQSGGRRSLSLFEALRRQALYLTASFVGLYGAIQQISAVIDVLQVVEAAESRLGVVFRQDTDRVEAELSFLRAEAARLGISFEILSDEYGKFAVAADAANFSSQNTRKIFLSVAEAARVNKLSTEQMTGVFLALQQMISKGKVSSEELRRQLGDRLAGAFNIFADAIGVSTAELDKMMRAGEVIADESTLLKFANQLNERFGPQLSAALKTTTTEIGRFYNEVFNARALAASGGIEQGLKSFLIELNAFFQSDDGREFFISIGEALGSVLTLLARVPDYLGLIQGAFAALIGLKLGSYFAAIVNGLLGAVTAGQSLVATMAALRAGSLGAGAAISALAGPIGVISALIGAGVVFGLTQWVFHVDEATKALDEHRRQMDIVVAAYVKGDLKAKGIRNTFKNLTLDQAVANARLLRDTLEDVRREAEVGLFAKFRNADSVAGNAVIERLKELQEEFIKSGGDITTYKDALVDLKRSQVAQIPILQDLILKLLNSADASQENSDAIAEVNAVIRVLNGTATETDNILLGLVNAFDKAEVATSAAAVSAEDYADALDTIKGNIPELAIELKKLKDLAEIDDAYNQLIKGARSQGEASRLAGFRDQAIKSVLSEAESDAIKEIAGNTKITAQTLGLIKGEEGFRADAYKDVGGKTTIGFGSTTFEGKPVTMGMSITNEQAYQQLVRDVAMFAAQVDELVKVPITDAMRDALISYAYNTPRVSESILEKLNALDYAGAQAAIRGGINTVNGVENAVLTARRGREADVFGSGGLTSPEIMAAITAEQVKQANNQKEFNEEIADGNAERLFELQNARETGKQQAINAAVRERQIEADKAGLVFTKEQRAELERTVALEYDRLNPKEEIEKAEERLNQLIEKRAALESQLDIAKAVGDVGLTGELTGAVNSLNTELLTAIENVVSLYEKMGGPEADVAIEKLNATAAGVADIKTEATFLGLKLADFEQLTQSFASGLAGAFDSFVGAIFAGESAIDAAKQAFLQFASDFLRQIAQMILQQLILNAIQGIFGGATGGLGGLIGAAVRHDGGLASSAGPSRAVPLALFHNALRMHGGGVAGLSSNEIPTILERNEEVLQRSDPRHVLNGGASGGGGSPQDIKVINAIDSASILSEAMNTTQGQKVIMNFLRANRGAIGNAAGG